MVDLQNPFAALKRAVSTEKPVEKRIIRHSKEREIIEHCLNTLSLSEAGQELIDFARENEIKFTVLRGRTMRDYAPNSNNAYIVVPDGVKMDAPEILIHFTGALREAIQEYDPDLRRPSVENGESFFVHRMGVKGDDKLVWQTIIAYELGKFANKPEYIDSFAAMGYYHLIDAYEKDLTEF